MPPRIRVFLDSSALFAAVWSAEGGARMVLKLGEAEAVSVLVSSHVLHEVEGALSSKAADHLALMALLLDQANIETVKLPDDDLVQMCISLTGHPGDAQVLAAAWSARSDYFVTLDRKHLLGNAAVENAAPFPLGTPGDFLEWFRSQLEELS